jgi:hypothetical protein
MQHFKKLPNRPQKCIMHNTSIVKHHSNVTQLWFGTSWWIYNVLVCIHYGTNMCTFCKNSWKELLQCEKFLEEKLWGIWGFQCWCWGICLLGYYTVAVITDPDILKKCSPSYTRVVYYCKTFIILPQNIQIYCCGSVTLQQNRICRKNILWIISDNLLIWWHTKLLTHQMLPYWIIQLLLCFTLVLSDKY